jgi:hypothetical protein
MLVLVLLEVTAPAPLPLGCVVVKEDDDDEDDDDDEVVTFTEVDDDNPLIVDVWSIREVTTRDLRYSCLMGAHPGPPVHGRSVTGSDSEIPLIFPGYDCRYKKWTESALLKELKIQLQVGQVFFLLIPLSPVFLLTLDFTNL